MVVHIYRGFFRKAGRDKISEGDGIHLLENRKHSHHGELEGMFVGIEDRKSGEYH